MASLRVDGVVASRAWRWTWPRRSPTRVELLAPTLRLVDFHTGRLEKSLLKDLHDEKKMQKKLYDAIKGSDEQWTLVFAVKDVVVKNGADPGIRAIYYVELPADETFSTVGLQKIDNVPALTTPFAYLTVAVAQAGRAQAGGSIVVVFNEKFAPRKAPRTTQGLPFGYNDKEQYLRACLEQGRVL